MATSEPSYLGECEFSLISELNSQLIIHHPYRSLTEIQSSGTLQLSLDEISLAWNIINDHYLTNLPLLYPPHVIAVTAIFLAVVMKPNSSSIQVHTSNLQGALANLSGSTAGTSIRVQKVLGWLADTTVPVDALVDITQELLSLYEVWDGYKESVCKEPIARFVRSRGLEK